MKKVVFPLALAVASVFASSAVFAATPYKTDLCTSWGLGGDTSKVDGDRYVIAGYTKTYKHEGGSAFYNETALFNTKAGFEGADDYSYQDFKWVAKKNINFPSRGSNFVSIGIPVPAEVGGKTNLCKNITVQSAPTISKKTASTGTVTGSYRAEVTSTYDTTYSKAAVEGVGISYRWNFNHTTSSTGDFYKVTSVPYVSANLGVSGNYEVTATISDGVFSDTVYLSTVRYSDGIPCNDPRDCHAEP